MPVMSLMSRFPSPQVLGRAPAQQAALLLGCQSRQQAHGSFMLCKSCRRRLWLPASRAEPSNASRHAWLQLAEEEARAGYEGASSLAAEHSITNEAEQEASEDHAETKLSAATEPARSLVSKEEIQAGSAEAGPSPFSVSAEEAAEAAPPSRAEVEERVSKVVALVRTAHLLSPYDKQDFNGLLLIWQVLWLCLVFTLILGCAISSVVTFEILDAFHPMSWASCTAVCVLWLVPCLF